MKETGSNELKELKEKLDDTLKEINRLNERLRESEERYYDLYENAPDMYHTINKKGIIIECNKTEAEMLGYPKEELIGKSVFDIQTEESRKAGKKAMGKLFRSGEIKGLELQFVKKSGDVMDVSINATVIYDKNGKAVGTRSVIRDITKKNRMMEIIKNSNFKLHAIFDAITDGICLIDRNFTIQNINKSVPKYFGSSPVDFIGKRCYIAFEEGGKRCEGCNVTKTFDTGEPVNYTRMRRLKDGTSVELEVSTFPVKGKKGKIEQVVYYMKDVTEKKRLERQMEGSRKLAALGEIVAGVTHEVRNPLQNILTGIDLLELEAKKKGLSLDILKNLRSFTGDMDFIIQELLDYSKPVKLELKEWAITDVVSSIMDTFEEQLKKGKIKVLKNYEKDLKRVYIDVRRIKQSFRNIIENSIHAMPDGGEFTAAINSHNNLRGEFISIRFLDSGHGISKKNIERVFEPFFSTEADGMGMGLAVAKRFVELHNGEIAVNSEEGKGCEVTVMLPVKEKL
ncbi:MAG: PAS domain S-box protein [Nitrospinae bacterium]|nr:PAS domain S-box protein [Nitrospinota bacterium]